VTFFVGWILYRYNPLLAVESKNPLKLDSRKPHKEVTEYMYTQNRFRQLIQKDEDVTEFLAKKMQEDVDRRWDMYEYLSKRPVGQNRNSSV
jgi:pyruvate-ferredoxin/flavodoxin oxidoreductase